MRRTRTVKRRIRTALAALAVVLPRRARLFVHRRLLGYEVAEGAVVGRAFIDVGRLRLADGASIGSLTAIRGCDVVDLGVGAAIGPLVWVNAVPRRSSSVRHQERSPALILGRGAAISCLHVIDATDEVRLEDFADLGGYGSQVLTHSIDLVHLRQHARPVRIGHHCLIGTRATLLPGTELPECSVLSAGSVIGPEAVQGPHRLYSGAPAVAGRTLNPRIPWFQHSSTYIE